MRQSSILGVVLLFTGCGRGDTDAVPLDETTDTDAAADSDTTDTDVPVDTDVSVDTDAPVDTDETTPIDVVATCPVPPLDELYPGIFPQSPWGDWTDAPDCLAARHDAIIILGCPSEDDGAASDCQTSRVDTALRFAAAGYGDQYIVTGGAVANEHVEAESLRGLLVARGVADANILVEPQARHTDENLYYSGEIMIAQGWDTALVISEPEHLLYTAVCDADCCVAKGRLSTFDYPVGSEVEKSGSYVLYPSAVVITEAECTHLEFPSKAMCTQLGSRLACADNFQL